MGLDGPGGQGLTGPHVAPVVVGRLRLGLEGLPAPDGQLRLVDDLLGRAGVLETLVGGGRGRAHVVVT